MIPITMHMFLSIIDFCHVKKIEAMEEIVFEVRKERTEMLISKNAAEFYMFFYIFWSMYWA